MLLPPGGPLLLGLAGALLVHRYRRFGVRLMVVALLLLYGCSIPLSAGLLSRALQSYPPLTPALLQAQPTQAIESSRWMK